MNFKTLFSHFVTLAFGEFASKAFGFLTMVYLARVLGADAFGFIGFVGAISAYAVLFSNFGIEQYASQMLSADTSKVPEQLIGTVLRTRFILSVVLLIPFVVFGFVYSGTTSEFRYFIFQSIFILAFAFNLQFYFVAVKRITMLTAIKTVTAICILLGSVLFVKSSVDLSLVSLITGIVTLAVFFLGIIFIVKKEHYRFPVFSFDGVIPLLKNAAPLGVSSLMIQIYYSADIVFLGFTNPGIDLGYYSGAYRIILILTTIPGLIYLIFLPDLAKITSGYFKSITTRSYITILICSGCILTAVSYIWAEEIIGFILGPTYLPAAGVLKILLLNVFMVFINVSLGNLLIAWNKHHKYLIVVTWGAVTNIVANGLLIPRYGIYGAAVSTILSECAVFAAAMYYHYSLFGLFNSTAGGQK